MKKIRVAILGQGRSGCDIHGVHLGKDMQRFKVVAVADLLKGRRQKAKDMFGCDTYDDYKAIFNRGDIDLVVNSLPSHMHVPVTLQLLKKGFNVLTEKPAARYAREMDELIQMSQKTGQMYAIFQQSRLALYFQKIMEIIKSGDLGRIIQIKIRFNGYARRWDWQCCQKFNGGSLLNTGPHPVDQALNLLNIDGMPEIHCYMDRVNTFGDAEDYVKLILTTPDKPIIDIEISSCDAYPSNTYDIQGSRGGLKGTTTKIDWRYYNEEKAPKQHLHAETLQGIDGAPIYCSEDLIWTEKHWEQDNPNETFTGAVDRFYTNIYEHLLNDAPLLISPQQVKQQIAVMEECHRQNPLTKMDI